MDFSEPDDLAAHREAARAWADAHVRPAWAEEQRRSGCHQTMELHALLARDGILGAGWPAEYGGSDVEAGFARAVFDELTPRGLQSDGWATTLMVARTIEHVGTEEQKRAYLPAALHGQLVIALGYSEPDSGSDVASAKTTAVRSGSGAPAGWMINGQKMFTSTAQVASHVFVLARTNPAAPKHKGLTLFLVPTASPGFELRPIRTLGGQVTNATFYSDVRVPDSARVGGVDEGWDVMKVALVYERGVGGVASLEQTVSRDLATWARGTRRPDGARVFDDRLVAERIGRIAVDEAVLDVLDILGAEGVLARTSWAPPSRASSSRASGPPWSPRSTAAPARSSARSSPNAALACPGTGPLAEPPGRQARRKRASALPEAIPVRSAGWGMASKNCPIAVAAGRWKG
jgi:alkylation response protein AidB-like acyl-CoA dehydrogenase